MKELRFQTSEKQSISLTENMDVAWLMSFAAEKSTVDPWTAKLLKRASRLLRETTGLYMTAMYNRQSYTLFNVKNVSTHFKQTIDIESLSYRIP